jgi:hypothetical protein
MPRKLSRPADGAGVRAASALLVITGATLCGGCQAMIPAAMPSVFAAREDARIAKLAARDSFPSPADVGLTTPTPVP